MKGEDIYAEVLKIRVRLKFINNINVNLMKIVV
jgi:hypothetical protein